MCVSSTGRRPGLHATGARRSGDGSTRSLVPGDTYPLCPRDVGRRGRPIRRSGAENPPSFRERTTAARLAPVDGTTCCPKAPTRARCSTRTSTCAPGRARTGDDDVLRHVRRPPARRGRDAAPRRRAARRCSTARRGEELAARRRAPPPGGCSTHDLPDAAARAARGRDRDARAAAGRPGARRAAAARRAQRATPRPSCGSRSRPTTGCTGASRPPRCAATTPSSSASGVLADAGLAEATRPARRRGDRRRRRAPPRARAPSSTLALDPDAARQRGRARSSSTACSR